MARPVPDSGRSLEVPGDRHPRWMAVYDRTRLTGWLSFLYHTPPIRWWVLQRLAARSQMDVAKISLRRRSSELCGIARTG